jgi:hypothetical protein
MKKTHQFKSTHTFSITATDVRAMAQIISHYEKLGCGVTCLSHDGKADCFEYVVRICEGKISAGGKISDVRVNANGASPVRELERVLIVDFSKAA